MDNDIEVLRKNYEDLQQSFDVLKREALAVIGPINSAPVRSEKDHARMDTMHQIILWDRDYARIKSFIERWGK